MYFLLRSVFDKFGDINNKYGSVIFTDRHDVYYSRNSGVPTGIEEIQFFVIAVVCVFLKRFLKRQKFMPSKFILFFISVVDTLDFLV